MSERPKDLRAAMRAFYSSSEVYRGLLEAHGESYQAPYVELVKRWTPDRGSLLEIGGGNGVGARMFAEAGYRVVGTDVSPLFLRDAGEWRRENLSYTVCDGLVLPFPDGRFDIVCSNEYLEHVPDAQAALDEMSRVTAPGGRVLVLGPNLCSPVVPMREAVRFLLGGRSEGVWSRSALDGLRLAFRNAATLERKKRRREVQFLYRDPDLDDQAIGGDSDSAYLANPVDLERYFRRAGWRIVKIADGFGWRGRLLSRIAPRYSPYLCFVAEKPGAVPTGR